MVKNKSLGNAGKSPQLSGNGRNSPDRTSPGLAKKLHRPGTSRDDPGRSRHAPILARFLTGNEADCRCIGVTSTLRWEVILLADAAKNSFIPDNSRGGSGNRKRSGSIIKTLPDYSSKIFTVTGRIAGRLSVMR